MKSKNIKIISAVCTSVAVLVTIGIEAIIGGAIGTSYAVYGAIMGGVIGAVIGYTINHSHEDTALGAAIGAEIGAIIGIIYDKTHHKDPDIDNSDYVKATKCALQTSVAHRSDAVGCGLFQLDNCIKTINGFSEITTCMGQDHNNYIIDDTVAA